MPQSNDDLQRFLEAQNPIYAEVLSELRRGHKRGHWMWFIFPQLRGLGQSPTSRFYGLSGRDETIAYGRHEILGSRLIECTQLVNTLTIRSIDGVFPYPDDLKFHSSITLFHQALPNTPAFTEALQKYFAGQEDAQTLRMLK